MAETEAAESCTVTLVENATTGYLWDYAVSDDAVLLVTDNGSAASDTELDGAPGTHSWTVTGAAAGEANVTFTYAQPWENGDIGESFLFTFAVDEALHVAVIDTQSNPGESDPDLIILTQYEDPASGMIWDYELSDDSVLQLAWDEYITAENQDGSETAGGQHLWAFRAIGEGDESISFICSGENDEEQAVVIYAFSVQDSHPALSTDSLQVNDGWLILGEDEYIILSRDDYPFLEEDERLLLSEDGLLLQAGEEILALHRNEWPVLSEEDIMQHPALSDALPFIGGNTDGRLLLGEDNIFLFSADELPILEEDERLLLSEDGLWLQSGDEILAWSRDEWPVLSEEDIEQYPLFSDALQSFSEDTDGKLILSLQDSHADATLQNNKLLIVPLSVDGDISFIPNSLW